MERAGGSAAGGDGVPGRPDRRGEIESQPHRRGVASAVGASGMSIRGADGFTLPNLRNDNQFCPFRARADFCEPLGPADGNGAGFNNDDHVLERALHCPHRAAGLSAVESGSQQVLFVADAGVWRPGLGLEDLDSCEWA